MKNGTIIFFAAFLMFFLTSSTTYAQWSKLGERSVGFVADHDEILVTAYKGTYSKIKFMVSKAPIHLHHIKIVYGNGENSTIKVDRNIPEGTESKAFDLPGNKRIIQKIVFHYKSIPTFKGKAHVEVYAKH